MLDIFPCKAFSCFSAPNFPHLYSSLVHNSLWRECSVRAGNFFSIVTHCLQQWLPCDRGPINCLLVWMNKWMRSTGIILESEWTQALKSTEEYVWTHLFLSKQLLLQIQCVQIWNPFVNSYIHLSENCPSTCKIRYFTAICPKITTAPVYHTFDVDNVLCDVMLCALDNLHSHVWPHCLDWPGVVYTSV